jgi:hypothetical protein
MVRCTTACYAVLNSKGIGPSRRMAQAEFPGIYQRKIQGTSSVAVAPTPDGRKKTKGLQDLTGKFPMQSEQGIYLWSAP